MSHDRHDHPEAREDYLEAVRHYRRIDDREGTSLSDDIIDRFEIAVAEVLADPEGWPRLHYWDEDPTVYKRNVDRFPYLVLFYLRGSEPVIIASATPSRAESPATGNLGSRMVASDPTCHADIGIGPLHAIATHG